MADFAHSAVTALSSRAALCNLRLAGGATQVQARYRSAQTGLRMASATLDAAHDYPNDDGELTRSSLHFRSMEPSGLMNQRVGIYLQHNLTVWACEACR